MPDLSMPGPTIALAPWVALARGPEGADAVDREVRARLHDLPLRAYEPGAAEPPEGSDAWAVTLPGHAPSLPPLLLAARTDLHDPAGLAGLVATLAVPALLAGAHLEHDVVVVVTGRWRDGGASGANGAAGGDRATTTSALAGWFEHRRRHDVKAAVVVARLRPARLGDLIHVAGVETDARLPTVLEGAAPPGRHLVLGRHGADGLPFAAHGTPYLRVGGPPGPATRPGGDGLADLERLAEHAARLVATLLLRLDAARLPGPYGGYDSTGAEIAALSAALGPRAGAFGGPPQGRADLDRILAHLGY
jgi:hypothetical protein